MADIADLLETHLPAGDPLAGYAGRLRDPALDGVLRGYLTGSLDLVFRLRAGRFVVVDYKTNWLGGRDETLTAWHYRPAALQAEMERALPLQASSTRWPCTATCAGGCPATSPTATSAACSICSCAA